MTKPTSAPYAVFLSRILNTTLGTLWWVREDLWEDSGLAGRAAYQAIPNRHGHPGVSLQPERHLPFEPVPMTIGFSGDSGPVVAWGLSKQGGPHYPTSFGRYSFPGWIELEEFIQPAADAKRDQLTGSWWERARVSPNLHKPRLSESEQADLTRWMQRIEALS